MVGGAVVVGLLMGGDLVSRMNISTVSLTIFFIPIHVCTMTLSIFHGKSPNRSSVRDIRFIFYFSQESPCLGATMCCHCTHPATRGFDPFGGLYLSDTVYFVSPPPATTYDIFEPLHVNIVYKLNLHSF